MSKISTTQVHDAISLLTEQHEEINELIEHALRESGNARDQVFFEARRLIAMHETAEQEVIHPAVRDVEPDGATIATHREREENAIAEEIGALEQLDIDSDEFTSGLEALREHVLAHSEAEEQQELPILGDRLDEAQLVLLAQIVHGEERGASTPPQPTAEGRAFKLIGDSFSAMVDGVRSGLRNRN